ncbi:MAG: methylmalonyl-CoA mutase family protein [Myxococcota bacterium]|nr:methylmalonyl-CoA mutase family protein [Myxococcota bacterium]
MRFVTAASLFDGHDAAINIMRRILQQLGAEVIHLGHDRSVHELIAAAIQEDAQGVAISSYQGGHMEYFTYLVDQLKAAGRNEIKVFGGGGGTITDKEIEALHRRGVERIYSVEDGRQMGLEGMIQHMIEAASRPLPQGATLPEGFHAGEHAAIARTLTYLEAAQIEAEAGEPARLEALRAELEALGAVGQAPVLGITGVGGAGKSSLTDELLLRFLRAWPERRIAVLSVDPTRRRSGGALLGDRIRMNSLISERIFMRSMATRSQNSAVSHVVRDALTALRRAPFDLVILETAGIGQSGSEVVDLSDLSLYVMTPEFGAPSQLEKIDMLDFADLVALNKADKQGAEDAARYVAKQVQRNRGAFDQSLEAQPVFPCIASRFGDRGVDRLFHALCQNLNARVSSDWSQPEAAQQGSTLSVVVPADRVRYLSEIAGAVRAYHQESEREATCAAELDGLRRSLATLGAQLPPVGDRYSTQALEEVTQQPEGAKASAAATLAGLYEARLERLSAESRAGLKEMASLRERYQAPSQSYEVRGRPIPVENYHRSLSDQPIAKVSLPQSEDWGELVRWRRRENLPGRFPFTAGVFPFKRSGEDPTRMFAGEGHPERSNRRFHYLSLGQPAARLSTAFDSVTLYGRDPARRPDIYGKVGNSGVSVATLDDAKRLYSGFDLCAPSTSVSMTINGPAPVLLAFFFNAAIDQQVERHLKAEGKWREAEAKIAALAPDHPRYRGELPEGHDGSGLGLLGVSGDQLLDAETYGRIKADVLNKVRGTVQADILKEDQAQNTCIFSTPFALKMMGDIQQYFIDHHVRNFYSISISGYHIAEAGANPISQLAFTLANGFTFVEYFKARGMRPDDFARNLSFFFSNGIDPEYAVIGRVARRIWAIAMRDLYGAGPRSQQLKYHIQTSGRSLHAQEIQFNDIRTTLQALYAIMDNCNSLHTNAYDEAITTPTEESVRRALAIQLIINRELGLTKSENPLQGSWFIEALTDLVEAAVLEEFERLTARGGVLGSMELMYQRGKIQEESMHYELLKHQGTLPIVGVNTFLPREQGEGVVEVDLIRASDEEKQAQLNGLAAFQERNNARSEAALTELQRVALSGENIFETLMETVKFASLGQISEALFAVGGQYRRNM